MFCIVLFDFRHPLHADRDFSVNINWGPGSQKWIFIDPDTFYKLLRKIQSSVPLYQNSILPIIGYLKKNKIKFHTLEQFPGDLVFIPPCWAHMVSAVV